MHRPRLPKAAQIPETRTIKTGGNPDSFDTQSIAWQFRRRDRAHLLWGWDKLKAKHWRLILKELEDREGLTWAEIKAQAGGRAAGTNSHSLDVCDFCKGAKDRLLEIGLDDCAVLFSFPLNTTLRLFGVV